jgi:PAS domain S-box-containing protein
MSVSNHQSRVYRALKQYKVHHWFFLDYSPIGVVLCAIAGELVDINPACVNIIGRIAEHAPRLRFHDVTSKSHPQAEPLQQDKIKVAGCHGPSEKYHTQKSGRLVPVKLSGKIISQEGEPYVRTCVEDISSRQRADVASTDIPRDFINPMEQHNTESHQLIGIQE